MKKKLDFDHFEEILGPFRDGKLFILTTVFIRGFLPKNMQILLHLFAGIYKKNSCNACVPH